MMSSRKPPSALPSALPSMWRLCKLGYRHEPGLLTAAFLISLLSALPDSLVAVWLKVLGDGVLQQNRARVLAASVALGVSAAATWFLRTVSTRVQRRFRDKVTIALESHVARLQASAATIAHHEQPEYLELRSAHDLAPVQRVNGSTLLAVAAQVGQARLIDNAILGGTE